MNAADVKLNERCWC